MTDKFSTTEKELDIFFRKTAEEAEGLPLRTITIPSTNNKTAGICLLAEDRQPSDIDALTSAIAGNLGRSSCSSAIDKDRSDLVDSLAMEIERARFTGASLSLVLVGLTPSRKNDNNKWACSILKEALHRVDSVSFPEPNTLAVLMPETGGQDAKERATLFLSYLGKTASGCGIFSCQGKECPAPESFVSAAHGELIRSCREDGRIRHNAFKEEPSCQVTVEERSQLFNLFSTDKDQT